MLPPPSPRHNNAESKKQAQESVRFLHSYACSGRVATASPHCAHRRYPQALSVLVRGAQEAARGKEGRMDPLPLSFPGQNTPRAGLAACCPQGSVCTRDKTMLEGGRGAANASRGVGNASRGEGNASCIAGTVGTSLGMGPERPAPLTAVGNGDFWSSSMGGSSLKEGGCTLLQETSWPKAISFRTEIWGVSFFFFFVCFLKPAQFQEHFLLKDS